MNIRSCLAFIFSIVFILVIIHSHFSILNISRTSPEIKNNELWKLPYEYQTPKRISKVFDHSPGYERKFRDFSDIFISKYISNHSKWRYNCRRSEKYANSTKFLLYLGSHDNWGIGDRIRGLLDAFLMAIVTKRFLIIHLQRPFPLENAWIFPERSDFSLDKAVFKRGDCDNCIPEPFHVMVEHNDQNIPKYLTDSPILFQKSMVKFQPKFIFRASSLFPDFAQLLRDHRLAGFEPQVNEIAPLLLKEIFVPSPELRVRLARESPFEKGRYLSIHARLGVGVNEGREKRFNATELGLTTTSLAKCLGRIAGVEATRHDLFQIFIASDTRDSAPSISEGIKEKIPGAEIVHANGRAMHMRKIMEKSSSAYDGFMTGFVDLGLLSRGAAIVHFPSGYADVAIWLGAMRKTREVGFSECVEDEKFKEMINTRLNQRIG